MTKEKGVNTHLPTYVLWIGIFLISIPFLLTSPMVFFVIILFGIWTTPYKKMKLFDRIKKPQAHIVRLTASVVVLILCFWLQSMFNQQAVINAYPEPTIEILSETRDVGQETTYELIFSTKDADYATIDGLIIYPDTEGKYSATLKLETLNSNFTIYAYNKYKIVQKNIAISRQQTEEEKEEQLERIAENEERKKLDIGYSIYKTEYERYDGAPTYSLLIDEVNLTNDDFKDDIKAVIAHLCESYKTTKVSFLVFDNVDSLNYGTNEKRHLIAIFDGELATMENDYIIMWFPSAFTSDSSVGKYVDFETFNPEWWY